MKCIRNAMNTHSYHTSPIRRVVCFLSGIFRIDRNDMVFFCIPNEKTQDT